MAALNTITGHELRALATQQRQSAMSELEDLANARSQHVATADQLRGELEAAWGALLEVAIPSLEPAVLDQAAHRLALPQLAAGEVARRIGERKAQLDAVIASIDADPAMRTRDEHLAKIDIRRRGLDEQMAPLLESVQLLEAEPGVAELIAVSYGTDDYQQRWWQPAYYRHWKRADELLAKHGKRLGAQDFAGLRACHLREREAAQTFLQERAGLDAEAAHLEELSGRRREAEAGLASLPGWALTTLRARLREHLQSLADEERLPLFADWRPLAVAGKRVAGLEAKLRYFAAIGDEWLMRPRVEVQQKIDKIERVLAKLAGSPRKLAATYDRAEMEAKLGLPLDRWRERRQRYQESANSIVVFQSYDSFDYMRDYLWWDLMTGGHVQANFIPEVSEYHARDQSFTDDATAAMASSYSRDRQGEDRTTSVDAS